MFDFAWSELAVIGVVALLVIGPKDLPAAIKAISEVVKKARSMASEFRTHVDDMVKDADLQSVRDSINEIRNLDIKGAIEKEIDRDGSLRAALDNPLDMSNTPTTLPNADGGVDGATNVDAAVPDPPADTVAVLADEPEDPTPAFIPPAIAHPAPVPDFLPPTSHRPLPGP